MKTTTTLITGKELIALGYKPGKWFADAIKHANANGLSGEPLRAYCESVMPVIVALRDEPLPYTRNISPANEKENENLRLVDRDMSQIMRLPTVIAGAVMPDACPVQKGHIPVGGVVVVKNAIHPAMHSADICCSLMATVIEGSSPQEILDQAQKVTHFGGGGRDDQMVMSPSLRDSWKANPLLSDLEGIADFFMGTQGDGNHFLFVGTRRSDGAHMIVTHHGSRAPGARLYKKGMRIAESYRKVHAPNIPEINAWIPFETKDGAEYWEALQLIERWTMENHVNIHEATAMGLGAVLGNVVWNPHNFVFRDGNLFYHAKGATPLRESFVKTSLSPLRLIPLNMSQPILVVKGEASETNLGFSPHGAGRNTSRSAHIRSKIGKTPEKIFTEETTGIDARFFSGNIDISELPSAYKDAASIQAQIEEFGLGEVVDYIDPYGCIMAGDWQIDAPWRKKRNTG